MCFNCESSIIFLSSSPPPSRALIPPFHPIMIYFYDVCICAAKSFNYCIMLRDILLSSNLNRMRRAVGGRTSCVECGYFLATLHKTHSVFPYSSLTASPPSGTNVGVFHEKGGKHFREFKRYFRAFPCMEKNAYSAGPLIKIIVQSFLMFDNRQRMDFCLL